MTRSQILNRIEIGKTDFIIDIGGGHRPFWRADLVIEKFLFDHSLHRNQPMQFPRVPVIKADTLALPIPDGGCDLVFASHLIEHLPDPARFAAEIKRCSRRVYLEFPSRNRALMFAWSFHAWLVETTGTVMRFYRNDLPQLFGPIFHENYDADRPRYSLRENLAFLAQSCFRAPSTRVCRGPGGVCLTLRHFQSAYLRDRCVWDAAPPICAGTGPGRIRFRHYPSALTSG